MKVMPAQLSGFILCALRSLESLRENGTALSVKNLLAPRENLKQCMTFIMHYTCKCWKLGAMKLKIAIKTRKDGRPV